MVSFAAILKIILALFYYMWNLNMIVNLYFY